MVKVDVHHQLLILNGHLYMSGVWLSLNLNTDINKAYIVLEMLTLINGIL